MEEINLLEHSTYDVEKIKKNREFFDVLMNKIKSTYKLFDYREYDNNNSKRVSFAPTNGRVDNVHINMNTKGEIDFGFNVSRYMDFDKLSDDYKVVTYNHHTELRLHGVTYDNYKEYLSLIVKAIEYCDYSFR